MNGSRRCSGLRAAADAASALACGLLLTAAGMAHAVPSTQLALTGGAITTPAVFGLGDLQALPSVTQTVNYTAGGVAQTRTYIGTSLWGMVDRAGVIINPAVRNDGLDKYVLGTGTDGYKVVFSLGELHPGGGNRPDLVAYQEVVNGVAGPIGADGFARVTAPGDIRGGRYVSNLYSLDVRASGSTQAATGGGPSARFSVTGDVVNSRTFDLAALQILPAITRVVNGVSYTGVSFWDLLNSAVGIVLNPAVNNDLLGKYVVATGSDGDKAAFSMGELSPNFGNQPDIIAYAADGVLLTGSGFARVVAPNDALQGRWVSNLVSLEVLTAAPVPEPAAWALMLAGLSAVAVQARRRRRCARPGPHLTVPTIPAGAGRTCLRVSDVSDSGRCDAMPRIGPDGTESAAPCPQSPSRRFDDRLPPHPVAARPSRSCASGCASTQATRSL